MSEIGRENEIVQIMSPVSFRKSDRFDVVVATTKNRSDWVRTGENGIAETKKRVDQSHSALSVGVYRE